MMMMLMRMMMINFEMMRASLMISYAIREACHETERMIFREDAKEERERNMRILWVERQKNESPSSFLLLQRKKETHGIEAFPYKTSTRRDSLNHNKIICSSLFSHLPLLTFQVEGIFI
jgi:hypothetical protein